MIYLRTRLASKLHKITADFPVTVLTGAIPTIYVGIYRAEDCSAHYEASTVSITFSSRISDEGCKFIFPSTCLWWG